MNAQQTGVGTAMICNQPPNSQSSLHEVCDSRVLEKVPARFVGREIPIRETYLQELSDLEAHNGIPISQSLDEAVGRHLESRVREMMHAIYSQGC